MFHFAKFIFSTFYDFLAEQPHVIGLCKVKSDWMFVSGIKLKFDEIEAGVLGIE
jgi:hypothetical protein